MVTLFDRTLCLFGKKPGGQKWKNLLPTIVLLASSSGCVIHEPRYQIIYTPDKPLTNSAAAWALPSPALGQRAAIPALHGGVEQQAFR